MNKQSTNKAVLGMLVLSLLGLPSCVDNDYDLSKDINMSVTVGGDNLTVPSSDTKDITLEKIFDLEEGSAVQADADGNYALKQTGERSDTQVSIDRVIIGSDAVSVTPASVDLAFHEITDSELEADVSTSTKFHVEKNGVTPDVIQLSEADVAMSASLNMRVEGTRGLTLKSGFVITFPKYLTVVPQDDRVEMNGQNLIFKNDIEVLPTSQLSIPLSVTHIDFENMKSGNGLIEVGHLLIDDEVEVKGTATTAGGNDVRMSLTTAFNIEQIELTSVVAKVDPEINVNISPISINNIPDFLKDEKVTVNMTDPRIFLTVSNDSPIEIDFKATLTSSKEGTLLATVQVGEQPNPVVIPGHVTDYVICLHRQSGDVEGADASVTVSDLNELIKTIPDEIRIKDVQAKAADKLVELTLGSTYQVNTDYEINAPLQFNDGTTIVYNDSFTGWQGDLEDIYVKELVVSLEATNTIPLGMEMTVEAIDAEGKVLDEVATAVSERIQAGTPEAPSVTALDITLKTTHPEAFKKLDGLKYAVSASSSAETAGQILNKEQHLRLDKMVIKVKGGVTVDLN